VNHRILGRNRLPAAAIVETLDAALRLAGRRRDGQAFERVAAHVREGEPALLAWLQRQPLRALALADEWPRLLAVVGWLHAHPRPGVYLRQLDLPGVHTKFIEAHKGVLDELLALALPEHVADPAGASFERRWGFREKPARLRFRMLDAQQALPLPGDQDVTLSLDAFARLAPPVARVFVTENEINYLAFPSVAASLIVFGGGYGVELLGEVPWLAERELVYWGDIDTHGFAILDRARRVLPELRSVLMDQETLLAHRPLWGQEGVQCSDVELAHLVAPERAVYDGLRANTWGQQVRLEQERLGWDTALRKLLAALENVPAGQLASLRPVGDAGEVGANILRWGAT